MDRLLWISMIVGVCLIVTVLHSLRREHIRAEYSLSWLAVGFLLFGLAGWPAALEWLAAILGVTSAASALLLLAFIMFVVVLYRVCMIVSNLKDNNIALAQKVAILEYQIRSLEQNPDAHRN
jgi:hypothetical protein